MNIKAVLFDLDGTLLPMNQDEFTKIYFDELAKKFTPLGFESNKLMKSIWSGIKAMILNNSNSSNEKVFWDDFRSIYGEKIKNIQPLFDEFYKNDFISTKSSCSINEKSKIVINLLKLKNIRLVLATNPIFPKAATVQRINWAGLKPEDFEIITTYENSNSCKPTKKYYETILKKLKLSPLECLMVGNDVDEDMVAKELGINVFLLTDCLINKENKDISVFKNGNFDDLLKFIDENID